MNSIQWKFEREVPVFADTEILVIGGGPAGIAAALALDSHESPAKIDISELQRRRRSEDVVLDLPR
jgi:2-polyprenyl-6-methoxyphenol hydroxylase-like FAD-dependent oxidoreductase